MSRIAQKIAEAVRPVLNLSAAVCVSAAFAAGCGLFQRTVESGAENASPQKPLAASDSEANAAMPYADLLEIVSGKAGLVFREDWNVWERQIQTSIDEYFESKSKNSTDREKNIDRRNALANHFAQQYRDLWNQGGSIEDAPLPAEIEASEESVRNLRYASRVFDERLGDYRPSDPTIYIDLSKATLLRGAVAAYHADALVYKDMPRPLSAAELDDLRLLGMAPVGVKLIYIDQDGTELPPGVRPETLDPLGGWGQSPDAELKYLVEATYDSWINPTPEQEKMRRELLQTPSGRRFLEIGYSLMMRAWAQRPHLWESDGSKKTPPPKLPPLDSSE